MVVENKNLILRPLSLSELQLAIKDIKRLEEILNVNRSLPPLSDKMAQIYNIKILKIDLDPQNTLFYTYWQIILKEENIIIGEIGFKGPHKKINSLEIGYSIEQAYQKRGFCTQAVNLLSQWAFKQKQIPINIITAETLKVNTGSQRVLKKCSFQIYGQSGAYYLWQKKRST